jgi:ribosomal RNA-processing protein 17
MDTNNTLQKQLREQRKIDLEKHVEEVNRLVKQANGDLSEAGGTSSDDDDEEEEEFTGFQEPEPINQEDEYVDEDKYTTVTIESVGISKAGFSRPGDEDEDAAAKRKAEEERKKKEEGEDGKKRVWTKAWPRNSERPKKKKKKFRYETKTERKAERMKQGLKKRKQKEARTSK